MECAIWSRFGEAEIGKRTARDCGSDWRFERGGGDIWVCRLFFCRSRAWLDMDVVFHHENCFYFLCRGLYRIWFCGSLMFQKEMGCMMITIIFHSLETHKRVQCNSATVIPQSQFSKEAVENYLSGLTKSV